MRDKANDPMRLSLMLDAIHNIETYMKGIEDYDDFAGNKIIFMPLKLIGAQ